MSGRTLFSIGVLVATVVAVVVVLAVRGGDGDDEKSSSTTTAAETKQAEKGKTDTVGGAGTETKKPAETTESEEKPAVPTNPDETKGDEEIALTRAANLRKALRILDRKRQQREGVFDQLRVAPGRIDTVIQTPDKRLNLQIRPDFSIPFSSESDFPNDSDPEFRKKGVTARNVDETVPGRMLRSIDEKRGGSAAHDIDYFVISRDIIDFRVRYGAYFRSGPRPRIYLLEDGQLRAIG